MGITEMRYFIFLFLLISSLSALEKDPWLGNFLEFTASLEQEHTSSHSLHTKQGTKRHFLHSEKTKALVTFMPQVDLGCAVELDLSATQKHRYGFDAVKGGVYYSLLNDLTSDVVSITPGLTCSLSPHARIHDLSSTNHSEIEIAAELAIGKEFAYKGDSFWRAWANGYAGVGLHGAPWLGLTGTCERIINDRHSISAFAISEHGLSHHKLHRAAHFQGWSRVGYSYADVGLRYTYKQYWLGTFYATVSKRLLSHSCPGNLFRAELGVIIPFSVV